MKIEVRKDVFICSLHVLQRAEITIKLANKGISVKDIENFLKGRLCNLEEVINIHGLSSIKIIEKD